MTINEAFKEFSESAEYKALSKGTDSVAGKYRAYLSRFKKDKLKLGAMAEILVINGYEVKADKVIKKNKKV